MTLRVTALVSCALTLAPALVRAQAPGDRMRDAINAYTSNKWMEPLCSARKNDDKSVTKAQEELKRSLEDKDAAKRAAAMEKVGPLLAEGLTKNPKNGAAWFALARLHFLKGDIAGADSALTKLQAVSADCEFVVRDYRQAGWAPLANAGIEALNRQQADSALAYLRAGSILNPTSGVNQYAMAYAMLQKNDYDGARGAFERAIQVGAGDTTFTKQRQESQLRLAQIYQQQNKPKEALATADAYLKELPNDREAQMVRAWALRSSGDKSAAAGLEKQLLGENAGYDELMNFGVTAFNDGRHAEAADAFARALRTTPGNRDATFNLANAYLALKDGAKLVETSRALAAIEPMAEAPYKLQIAGWNFQKNQAEQVKAAEALEALPLAISVTTFQPAAQGARLVGTATGRSPKTLNGQAIKATPVTVTFEFVDKAGATVATSDVALGTLAAGSTKEITLDAKGAGIVSWRYKRKA